MGMIENIKKWFGIKESISDPSQLREGVRFAYSSAANDPKGKHPFPVGKWFAESVGYPRDILDSLPTFVSESFTGVSNVSIFAEIPIGSTVLDLGCGAGLDCLIAAQKVGKTGRVIGVDFSNSMLEKASKANTKMTQQNIEFHCAEAENLPFSDESVDVIIINGIFNLNPFRHEIFRELARVIKHGGSVYAAELIFKKPQTTKEVCDLSDWFA